MVYKEIDILNLAHIAHMAGDEIMKVYARDFTVEVKDDQSPLTEADKSSNEVILKHLHANYPAIPIISEETANAPYDERKYWKRFWLVDPLDGTKEFIRKNGEFTVNIALIEDGMPMVGIVYAPALQALYLAAEGIGAFKYNNQSHELERLKNAPHYSTKDEVVVVASRSHLSPETQQFVDDLKANGKQVKFHSSGSSLKFCLVAEGVADVYPRFGPTMEWDTAAAHAIAINAGRHVLNTETKQPLEYNKENLLNPFFIVE